MKLPSKEITFIPAFYWTGDLAKDAMLINRKRIFEHGNQHDRTSETLGILIALSDRTKFKMQDALDIQSMLLNRKNTANITPGLRTEKKQNVLKAEFIEQYFKKMFPVIQKKQSELMDWYNNMMLIEPLTDLNDIVFGIIVSILNFNYQKSKGL